MPYIPDAVPAVGFHRCIFTKNTDHLAVAVPIGRTHRLVSSSLVDADSFPREAMYESLMRLIEEDLQGKEAGWLGRPTVRGDPNSLSRLIGKMLTTAQVKILYTYVDSSLWRI